MIKIVYMLTINEALIVQKSLFNCKISYVLKQVDKQTFKKRGSTNINYLNRGKISRNIISLF